jgi:hypothetical protein
MATESQSRANSPLDVQSKRFSAGTLESFSKAIAALLVALYVLGFMIVTLHNASFGFADLSPFKPKILSAGVLLLVMTLLPALVANSIYSHDLEIAPEQRFSRAIVSTLRYYVSCIVLTVLLAALLSLPESELNLAPHKYTPWYSWLLASFGPIAALIGLALLLEFALKKSTTHPMLTAAIAGLGVAFLLFANFHIADSHRMAEVTIWLFAVGVVSALMNQNLSDPKKRKQQGFIEPLTIGVAAVALFSGLIYPQFKSSWGGGSPIPVVIYFSSESRFLPGQQLEGDLLDEADSGFYITQRGQTRAIFIPRSKVAILYFSNTALDPNLVNDPARIEPK